MLLAVLLMVAVVVDGAAGFVVQPNNPAITWSGRSIVNADGSRTSDWAAQTILLSITGTTNISLLMNESKTNRYAVYNYSTAEGATQVFPWGAHGSPTEIPRKMLLTTNSSTNSSWNSKASIVYPLFTKVQPSARTNLLIFKTSEGNGVWMPFGANTFRGFVVDDGATVSVAPPPWRSSRRLEIFGDSITCCFGCTGSVRYDPKCDGVKAEDAWFSWGAQLARTLQAEMHLQAWSAIGLLHDATPFSPGVMETMVARTLGGTPDTPQNAWDFDSWPPSAVVVNLGVNDGLSLGNTSKANSSQWAAGMLSVAQRYKKGTPILLTVGPWLPAPPVECGVLCEFSKAAVAYGRRLGYNFSYYRYPSGSVARNGTSCGGHPEADAHEAMAAQLSPLVKEMLGW